MDKKITSALISVFYKEGLEPVIRELEKQGVTIYSTGGTQKYIEELDISVIPVEDLTSYPSILGGRVKTLHPSVFGGILGRRNHDTDVQEMKEFEIPIIDLVIVDLYPFKETLSEVISSGFKGNAADAEKLVVEKIDIGGPSMIRAAAKNYNDVAVIASRDDYASFVLLYQQQNGCLNKEQRKSMAARAFHIVADYDIAINNYFNSDNQMITVGSGEQTVLRYGENPHQHAIFYGHLDDCFRQLNGKEISYNNLVDIDAAIELVKEFGPWQLPGKEKNAVVFAIIKHTNVCGISIRESASAAWEKALAGDPESAFGGVLVCNGTIDEATAQDINEIFFEVLLAPAYEEKALQILSSKKNRIVLQLNHTKTTTHIYKNAVNGTLRQNKDAGNFEKWEEAGGRQADEREKEDLVFANLVCKHLKSNAIALVKNKQLIGKGCGQTSRIDALRQAIEKAKHFNFDLRGAVMASDAFFPFNDCVQMGDEAGITAFIQPGGSIRDKDSIEYCVQKNLAMIRTGMRHFRH